MSLLSFLALAALLAWLLVLVARRGFWRCDQRLEASTALAGEVPGVVAVVPARNEAPTIGQTVRSLLNQSYPGPLRVVVVDDHSIDGTAEAARAGAAQVADGAHRLQVVSGSPLPPGWSGKLWAVHQGLAAAADVMPDARYVLLTDADIEHAPGNLARLVGKCERDGLVMASLMVKLRCRSLWEHLLVPAFVFFFQKLYPFPQVNDPDHPVAAAAGGCILARCETLETIGGVEAIRGALIDDCALAKRLKEKGRIWMGLAGRTRSLRAYDDLGDLWRMVARTAYAQLQHSPVLLVGTVAGMTLLYLVPPGVMVAGLATGDALAALLGLAGWLGMAALYRPTLRLYRRPAIAGLALPLAALLYTLMTLDSARRHVLGRGGEWKGRTYAQATGRIRDHATATPVGTDPQTAPGPGPGPGQKEGAADRPAPGADQTARLASRESRALAAHVTRITKASGTSFYGAMRILPKERREAMYAVYAFCRAVDDIADDLPGGPEDKRAHLAAWRADIDRLYDPHQQPHNLIARALDGPRRRYALRRDDFMAVIEGMEMDAAPMVRLADMTALEQYCDRVACAVGRLSNRIFGVDPALADDVARHTGLALQLTNILRDVAEDAKRNRLYLPQSRLHVHGLDDTRDLDRVLAHPATAKVCAELASKAQAEYDEARHLHRACARQTIRPAVIMAEVYHRTLIALRARGWERLDQPVRVSRLTKAWIALRHGTL